MKKLLSRRKFVQQSTASVLAGRAAGLFGADSSGKAEPRSEWRYYGGDQQATHYSPLDQITADNVAGLEVAWVHRSADEGSRYRGMVECTPLVIDGIMYITGAGLKTQALDAASGKPIWTHNSLGAASGRRALGVSRGVTYWRDGNDERIFAPVQNRIWCLDAKSGKPVAGFGESGAIDLEKEVDRDMGGLSLVSTTPGAVYRDLLIVTSRTQEGPRPAAPGHIRAYDVHSGKRRWIFHTIPHPGEFGYDTWSPDSWKTAGGANCWGGMSVDVDRGLVFLSTGSPAFDFYGGDRVGMNLFGNCVLALKAETGERVWHFQTVHHDVWDYDVPCQPTLVTIRHKGQDVDIVAQASKTGWVYLLDRETGELLYPVEERAVPESDLPGEKLWPTQPFPANPPPFSRQDVSRDDLTDISPEAHAFALERLKNARFGKMFTPPGKRETIAFPGFHGGALWGGASFDPESQWLFVNHNEIPWSIEIVDAPEDAGYPYDHTGYKRLVDQDGYPIVKPPWGQIAAIDLKNCKIVWQSALGEYKELSERGIPATGTYIRGGNVATKGGVLFSAGTLDNTFRAFEAKTGKVLWETDLGGGGFATPSTYEANGKQYVVVPVSGTQGPGERRYQRSESVGNFVAFALPG